MKKPKNFNSLEELLQTEANNFELFANDRVWKNIANTVQEKRQWPALTIITFAIVVLLSVSTFLNYPPDNLVAKLHFRDSIAALQANTSTQMLTHTVASKNFIENFVDQTNHTIHFTGLTAENNTQEYAVSFVYKPANTVIEKTKNSTQLPTATLAQIAAPLYSNAALPLETTTNTNTLLTTDSTFTTNEKAAAIAHNEPIVYAPATSTTYTKVAGKKQAKFTTEIYVTPSFSYRKLEDANSPSLNNSNPLVSTALLALNVTTPLHELIRHKPALGIEVGAAMGYAVTKNLVVKLGAQFNVRKYYIDAFTNNNQTSIATLTNNAQPIMVVTALSNSTGNQQTSLTNQMYQLSMPIGVDWKLLAYKKLSIHAAASIQPTVTLNKSVYLLSTDYKYYASGENFFRQFNINTAADVNFRYNTNKGSFYIGPQIRYQHLPTYNHGYSIKEYRWDYGVKLGFIKSIKN